MRKAKPGREKRLKKRDFDLAFKHGRRAKSKYFELIVLTGQDNPRKPGVVVPKRIGKAVVRNRVKRRIREILRQEQGIFSDGVIVVVLTKPPIIGLRYRDLRDLIIAKLEEAIANDDIEQY